MTNINPSQNPYKIGQPIHETEFFFGREDLFSFIEYNLNDDIQFLLLHGQRRIGKSSILRQIPHKVAQDKFVFVFFDLQGYSHFSLSNILYNLAEAIPKDLDIDSDIITLPSDEELNNNPNIFSNDFLPQVFQELGNKKLVLLLDEFDVLSSDSEILNQGESFFRYLQSLLNQHKKLFIIPVVGRAKDDFHTLSQLFNGPPFQEIGLLYDLSARQLITRPAQNIIKYEEDAIQEILKLSARHPYFIQNICFNLFIQATIEETWTVTRSDVQNIVDKAIESATGGLTWFWDGLSISEKVVFSAVAEAQKIAIEQNQSFPEDPLTLLKKYGVVSTDLLIQAAQQLAIKGYLDDNERRVKVELVRRWLLKYHPLNQEIFKLEEIEIEKINEISEDERQLYRDADNKGLIAHYEKILELNPNHFSTLPVIAQIYLKAENFGKALELYQRAYQLNSTQNQEGLLLALETYGKNLIGKQELIKAKVQFERVLEIEPDRESAQQKLEEIEVQQQEQATQNQERINPVKPDRKPVIISAIAALIAFVGGIGISQISSPCAEGQQKVNGRCISIATNTQTPTPTPTPTSSPDNIQSKISRGDRTLFSSITNPDRDQGIEEFKKSNYPLAIEFFEKATKYDLKDPEIRIYYNNAKARKKGNLLTLAVVVPADNPQSIAQEILRGVAQAQQLFNADSGLNGRLLEIVIANDGNDPNQAKQIAQQLVKDNSVLGIIGHYSSETTFLALDVYKTVGMPVISPTSTANTLKGKNFFRTVPSDTESGRILAKYAQDSHLNKVAIFYNPKDSYSNSQRNEFEKQFQGKGQIVHTVNLKDPTLNIDQELKDITSQQVQAQAVMLFPDIENISMALEIAKLNADNNLGLKLLAGSTLYNQKTLQDGKNAVEGLVIAVPWFSKAPQSQKFVSDITKQWQEENISWRTATSFDATQAFTKSLRGDLLKTTILQELGKINLSSTQTSGDVLKFDKGERQSKVILVKVEGGQFSCLQQSCSP